MITKHKWIICNCFMWINMSQHLLWKLFVVVFGCVAWGHAARTSFCNIRGLKECSCSSRTVNCTNKNLTTAKGLTFIPDNYPRVQHVIFKGNQVGELDRNMLVGNCTSSRKLNDLRTLDLSDNHITEIHGKTFHCTPNLDTLILDNNNWLVGRHVRVFSNLNKLKRLHLINTFALRNSSKKHITHLRWVFNHSKLMELEEIHLERNHIYFYKSNTFCQLPALKKLYLSSNNILSPDIDYECMRNRAGFEIYLDGNSFTTLSSSFMNNIDKMHSPEHPVKMLNISNNPYTCNCELKNFHEWLNKTIVPIYQKDKLKCVRPEKLKGRTILSLKPSELQCRTPVPMDEHLEASYVVIGIILGVIGVLFLVVLYLNREGIKERVKDICEPLQLTHAMGGQGHFGYASVQNPDI